MATIQIVLQAINNASRTFDEVAGSLEAVNVAQEQAAESARALSDAELAAAQSAVDTVAAYSRLREETQNLAGAAGEAVAGVRALTDAEVGAANAAARTAVATRALSNEELGYGARALETAFAVRALTDAELGAAEAAMGFAGGVRELSAAELDAANHAAQTALAVRALTDAELGAAQGATETAFAFRALSDAELGAAQNAMQTALAVRALTSEELGASGAAMQTAVAFRALSAAELEAANQAAVFATATRMLDAAEIDAMNSTMGWAASMKAAAAEEERLAAVTALTAAGLRAGIDPIDQTTRALGAGVRGWGFWGAALRAANIQVPLFGGALDGLVPKFLTQISVWHILGDAIIEVLAVWIPAGVAIGAWGVAASDAINNVIRHMTDLHTVADATGQAITPMTDNLEKLHDAVQPQVYQIFGDALSVATKRGGELNSVIMQTGQVLDQLAARATMAIQSSSVSGFLKNSVNDVRLLGTAFGNLFGIIGNLVRMNQGWAGILLTTGTAILGLIEKVTSLIIPLGQVLVLGHGFVLWVGLAITAVVKFGGMLAAWGAGIVAAVTDFVGLIGAIRDFIAVYGVMEALSLVNPMAWVAIAVGALAGLVAILSGVKDATQKWADSMESAAQNAQTLSQGIRLLTGDVAATSGALDSATAKLNQLSASSANSRDQFTAVGRGMQTLNTATGEQARKVEELQGVNAQFSGQLSTYATRLDDLAAKYGGVSNAQGLLVTAGITMKQMLDQSGQAWATIKTQVEGAYQGYKAMGVQTGTLGNDMQVLDKQATDQYNALQKLNQGWDAQTTAMTGAITSFDTVAQGFNTLSSGSAKFTDSLGRLKVTGIDFVKSGIDGLTPSSIALNQAFAQQVGNINTLADSWRSAGISSGQFNSGIAAAIAPLEKYAAGSQEATAQLVGLAQEAGYQGPVSLDALNKYLGITSGQLKNTSGDMKTMQSVAQQATVQEALLTSAMQSQGNMITSQLIGDINQAILKYDGVAKAAAAYGNAIAEDGRQSDAAKAARTNLINDIIAAGRAAGDTTTQIAAMITKVLGIPKQAALQIIMDGQGKFTIQQLTGQGLGVQGPPPGVAHANRGMMVRGGAPNKDGVLIAAQHGELVVPTRMVQAGAVDHLRGQIPGFNAGGLVQAGDRSVLTGDYAVTKYGQFKTTFETAMVHAMQGAMAGAEKAAAGASGKGGAAGPAGGGGGSGRAALQSAAQARGWGSGPEWNALYAVEMREAGFNLGAKNPSSGAYGMAQFINGPSEYYQYGGDPNTAAGQATAMLNYIAQRYGDPIAAWAHEQNYGWYDQGGLLPPGLSLALNQTGSNEMVLPNGVIQGFTGGMQQLHPFFNTLTLAIGKLTDATTKAATASTATTTAVKATTAAATAAKPTSKISADQKKIAADKANAATLAARISAVETAIKDTPAKDTAARKNEENLLKTLQSALAKQNKTTGADEKALAKEIVKENKATVAAMQKQIAAITKLLGSGSAATSPNALWSKLTADEHTLAAAQKMIAAQMSGASGGSAKGKVTATVDKSSLAGLQAGEVKAFNAAVAKLKADLAHPGGTPVKQIEDDLATLMKRQAAEVTQYNKTVADATYKNLQHLMALAHDEDATATDKGLSKLPGTAALMKGLQTAVTNLANAAKAESAAATKTATATAKASSGGGGGGSSSYSSSGVVTDKKTENTLASILAELRKDTAEFRTMCTLLSEIKKEADPAAQAKAIGPAVASALNSAARSATQAKTTRRG